MTGQSILIVNYYFPPFQRVGGRRWAKFAKYLFRRGWDIHVVAGDFPGSVSPWDKDTKLYRDRIHRVTRKSLPIPYFKQTLPKSPVQKIRWKFSQWVHESFTKKKYVGDYTDPSYIDGPAFAAATRKNLESNPQIKHVIVSVGPYYYAMDILKLKKDFPSVLFWLDYRDEWTSRDDLSAKQKKELKEYKHELNQLPDAFLSVYDFISKDMNINYRKPAFTIPHAFDDDDFEQLINLKPDSKKLQFVYGGDLYLGFEPRLTLLSNLLSYLNNRGFDAKAIIYADKRKHPHQQWNHVIFKEPLMLDDFFKAVKESDFSMILRGSLKFHQFSTKVFELIKLGRPILVIDDHTPEIDFIENNRLGLGLMPNTNLEELTEAIIKQKTENTLPRSYNLETHTTNHTCSLLCELLNKELQTISNQPI